MPVVDLFATSRKTCTKSISWASGKVVWYEGWRREKALLILSITSAAFR